MILKAVVHLFHTSARNADAGTRCPLAASTPRSFGGSVLLPFTVIALCLVSIAAQGQTAMLTTLANNVPEPNYGAMQASDGNFYSTTPPEESISVPCDDGSSNDCSYIYKITPSGTASIFHTFVVGGSTNTEGGSPTPLIEAPDGNLYGTCTIGGASGIGTIFKITPAGVLTVLHTFAPNGAGYDVEGARPGPLTLGSDGNFYGVTEYGGDGVVADGSATFFSLSPNGEFTKIHSFTQADGASPYIFGSHDFALVQGIDGNFYGGGQGCTDSSCTAYTDVIYSISPAGNVTVVSQLPQQAGASFPYSHRVPGPFTVGPDGAFYGISLASAPMYGSATASTFRFTSSRNFQTLSTFDAATGSSLDPRLTLGSDGNFYGSSKEGGDLVACPQSSGCGTLFQLQPGGTLTTLHTFSGPDGGGPEGPIVQVADGSFVGVDNGADAASGPTAGIAFDLSFSPALPAPVQLSFSNNTTSPQQPLVLTWKVLNAFSATMQQCHASIQNTARGAGAGAGMWAGPQTGTMMGAVYTGNATITPTAAGTYTYALNCGGVETGSVTLIVGNGPTIVTSSLPNAAVGKTYRSLIQTIGGTQPYHYSTLGDVPPGLTIDGNLGVLSGTPKQFGDYKFGVYVQDSANPPLDNTATFTLTVDSTLALSSTLPNPTLNAPYNASLPATGGYGGYKFVLAAGKLPVGLTLNATTGILSGTATVAGKYTFTITLTDGEDPMDEVTQVFNVSTVIPPLAVEGGGVFPSCTVEVLCEGQFTATGGVPPYTWAIAPGTKFPAGLTLDPDGGFTGKPLQMNSLLPEDLEVQVTDSENPPVMNSGTNQLSIASGLKVVSVDLPQATVGMAYAAPPPVATGGLPPYTWVIQPFNPEIIPEYSADPKTGALKSLGPLTPGSFYFNYTVIDSETHPAYASNKSDVILVVVEPPLPTATVLSSSNSAAGTGMTVTLTAKVSKTGAVPTGVVVFYSGTAALGTATLDATGSASLQTSFSTPGTFSLTAAYSGDGASAGSVSTPLAETVVTPTVSASLAPSTLTLTSGQSGTILITLTPAGGYTGTVAFSCGQLPAHVSCAFAPSSVIIAPGATSVTDTLTINTAAPTLAALEMPAGANGGSVFAALTLWLPASMLALFGLRRKAAPLPRLLAVCLFTLSLAGALTLTGCGSTSPNIKAAPGTYSIPITLTLSGGVTNSLTATVVVQ